MSAMRGLRGRWISKGLLLLMAAAIPLGAQAQADLSRWSDTDRDAKGWLRLFPYPNQRVKAVLAESSDDAAFYLAPGRITVVLKADRLDESFTLEPDGKRATLSLRDQKAFERASAALGFISAQAFQHTDRLRVPRWVNVEYFVLDQPLERIRGSGSVKGSNTPICTVRIRGEKTDLGGTRLPMSGPQAVENCYPSLAVARRAETPNEQEASALATKRAHDEIHRLTAVLDQRRIGLQESAAEARRKEQAKRHGYLSFTSDYWSGLGEGAKPLRDVFEGGLNASGVDDKELQWVFFAYVRQRSSACPDLARRDGIKFSEIQTKTTFGRYFGSQTTVVDHTDTWVEPRFAALFRHYADPETNQWGRATPLERALGALDLLKEATTARERFISRVTSARELLDGARRLIDENGCGSAAMHQLADNIERNALGRPSLQAERQGRFGSRPGESFYSERGRWYFGSYLLADETVKLPPFTSGGQRYTYQDVVQAAVEWKQMGDRDKGYAPIWLMFSDDAGGRYFISRKSDPISEPDVNDRIYIVKIGPEFLKHWHAAMAVEPEPNPALDAAIMKRRGPLQFDAAMKHRDVRLVVQGTSGYVDFLSFGDSADPAGGKPEHWPGFHVWREFITKNRR